MLPGGASGVLLVTMTHDCFLLYIFLGAVRTLNIFQKYLQVRKKIGPEVIFNPLQI